MKLSTFILIYTSAIMSKIAFGLSTHFKCRGGVYPRSNIERFPVPDDKVNWTTEYEAYKPAEFTSSTIHNKPWADPNITDSTFKPKWNQLDENINRASYVGKYDIINSRPINPIGRTGIIGRGVLGRWGPNHAADPVVTRWKTCSNGEHSTHSKNNLKILQFVAIQRRDTKEWALPGGMVDPGERVTAAAIREFQEEATNSLLMSSVDKEAWKNKFESFFKAGDVVYSGYVDDPRNTDNAWMETVAYNFHDENGDTVGSLNLNAGDDAVGVRWVDIDSDLKLYASHHSIVQAVANKLNAHWS